MIKGEIIHLEILFRFCSLVKILTIYFEDYQNQKLGVFLHKQIKNEFSLFATGNKNEASLHAFIQLRFLELKTLWKRTNLINEVNTKESKMINSMLSKVKLDLKNEYFLNNVSREKCQ